MSIKAIDQSAAPWPYTERVVAFDLDGTLCNIEHRLHFIKGDKKDWRGFFAACKDDAPVPEMIALANALGSHRIIQVWSGRSDEVRGETEAWLDRNNLGWITGRHLKMRKAGDHRPDYQVKAEWLDALSGPERPVMAFDDRQQVVDMRRSRGVICCQVAPGDF